MENLTVRKLTDKDEDIFEGYIWSFLLEEKIYLADNHLKNRKKYIEYRDFKEWFKTNNKDLLIYLVFSSKKKLIGSFQISQDSSCVLIDIRPKEEEKGYEQAILNFIYNACCLEDLDIDFVLSSISTIPLKKLEQSENIYTYKYDKNKVLIKKS